MRRLREAQQTESIEDTEPDLGEPMVYTFTDAELDEILAERTSAEAVEQGLRAIRAELREGLKRVGERVDEINTRLMIMRDPFLAMSVTGQRLRQQDEAERKAAAPPAGTRNVRRLP